MSCEEMTSAVAGEVESAAVAVAPAVAVRVAAVLAVLAVRAVAGSNRGKERRRSWSAGRKCQAKVEAVKIKCGTRV